MRSLLGRFHRPMSRGAMGDMLTMNSLGDGSTLSLDFTTMGGVLDPRLTFTRASTVATYVNSSGYVATATTNEPRFDYSPTNIGEPRGLLVEAPATNLFTRSNAMDQSPWFESANITRTTFTGGNGPDNVSNSGSKVSAVNIASGNTFYYNGTTTVSGTTYTYSVWAKAAGANWIWIHFFYFGVYHGAFFDLSGDGALGNTTGTIVAGSNTITKYPNGWFRLTISHTATYTIFYTGQCPATSNGTGYVSILGQSPNGVLLYGAQVEVGSSASSYIPTGASQVTRAVDTAIIAAGTNFSSWYTGNTSGTFVANWYGSVSSTTARSVMATSDQTTKHLHMYQTPSALTLRLADFGAAATVTTGNNLTANALTKGAFSYASTATSLCLNGGTVATGTLAFTVAPTWLSIGGPSTNGTSITDTTVMLNNSIRTIKYFPVRLSDAKIKEITT